ncbi:gamma-glutamyltransferase [Hymenobacter roseosalivarius DSM 11622]|uniref:Glutathione hydrolase proenzyme n=1 Tax=Hymenobacter roseosalivarius DSM 11622 TaxID=645990 RepID=A0A1W1VB83_9BACT|nr:gamma-glutamyltransferase [Hymenobacter roseosalivarius]SMB90669.1 gamma-glutamyltransferase [Hymenobacter roseosalivarius DSM 11622]
MKSRFYSFALLALLACTTTTPTASVAPKNTLAAPLPPSEPGLITAQAMVVSAHPEASRIGLEVLQKGGNAYDAAVAVQFALAVAFPTAGNLGGGGFFLYRGYEGSIGALDFREMAPSAANRDMYLDKQGNIITDLSTAGHLAAGVPGTVAGMVTVHQKLGKLPWTDLVQPAVELARRGVVLTGKEAAGLNRTRPDFIKYNPKNTPAYVRPDGDKRPWQAGDTIRYPDLARTLERIRDQGRAGFYQGPTAKLIVTEMQRGGGIITEQDLLKYQPKWRTPLRGSYRGYDLIAMPPPSSGGVALLQMLQMLEPYDLRAAGWHSPLAVHYITEAERRVYADRATYLGDPDFGQVPVAQLTDSNYVKNRMGTLENNGRATPSSEVQAGAGLPVYESDQTTHYSIVDAAGNAVSCTTTLNGSYGSKVVVAGAGFLLNNEMDDFSVKAGVPNYYGLVGGTANAIEPGKRMLSSMTPTIVTQAGKLFMVVGTPGGSTIITSVLQTIIHVLDYGMSMQQAVSVPRLHHQWLPDQIDAEENALLPAARDTLQRRGYKINPRSAWGRVDAIRVLPDGHLQGGADPRGDDKAMGY